MTFVRGSGLELTVYSNADLAYEESNDRRSASGTVVNLWGCGRQLGK